MNKKGFVSSSLIYSFVIIFIVLVAAIIGTYAYYHSVIFSSNRDIINSLNNLIESNYVKLTNYLENSGFEEPTNPSSATYNTDYLTEVHYDGSKDYKLDTTIDSWINENRHAYRYINNIKYSGNYALMLGNYNYSEIYQNGTQDYTYTYEVGLIDSYRSVYQNITNLSLGTHYIYISAKILRNRPTSGDNSINVSCDTGCYTEGENLIDLSGGYVDWHQESLLLKVEVTDENNNISFNIESNTGNSGVFILVDELLFTDVTEIINANLWELEEAKEYFDGTKLNADGTVNNRYKINYFEDTISYELFENYERVTIIFDNGEEVADTTMTFVAGQNNYTIVPPKRENYTFLGYFSRPDGTGTRYFDRLGAPNDEEYINKDMTLYAFWTNEIFYYSYTGSIEKLLITRPGDYRLEAWGAQGGSVSKDGVIYKGGYGGYSVGMINIPYSSYLYLAVGGQGKNNYSQESTLEASFNGGGGSTCTDGIICSGGGGATHIATSDGSLSHLSADPSAIILVAGGGGGAIFIDGEGKNGGSGGGYKGTGVVESDKSGTQNAGFNFGQGESGNNYSGSGGGYYGGSVSSAKVGTGGSGNINNNKLIDKSMYCYNCETSDDIGTKTISTNSIYTIEAGEFEPLSTSVKEGNGFIKITKIGNTLINYFELSFDGNASDSEVSPKTMWVLHNSKYGVLPSATRSGYEFLGWFTEAEGGTRLRETDTVKLTASQTIYAHWTLAKYTVTFDATGGQVSPEEENVTYTLNYGELPTPTRLGYTFEGWYTDPNNGIKVTSSTTVTTTKNHKLYAHWKANQYTVTFDANGGVTDKENIDVVYDNKYGVLPVASMDQYNFIGWYTQKIGGEEITADSIYKIAGNQVLYARWSNKKYEFSLSIDSNIESFNIKLGSDAPLNNQTSYNGFIPYLTEITISGIVTKTGYHYSNFTPSGAIEEIPGSDNATITFKTLEGESTILLQSSPNSFTINFNPGSGSGTMEPQTCIYDQDCTLNSYSFSKSGYNFSYWTDEEGNTYSNRANVKNILSEHNSSITLTAQWSKRSSGNSGGSSGGSTTTTPDTGGAEEGGC